MNPSLKEVEQMDQKKLKEFFSNLDRSFFLDDAQTKSLARLDRPLPIGFEQTISQPSLVLQMTSLLAPDKSSRVLEIGTGSGYQTALLAEFSGEVYTIERIKELGDNAREKLMRMGYENIYYKSGTAVMAGKNMHPLTASLLQLVRGKCPRLCLVS